MKRGREEKKGNRKKDRVTRKYSVTSNIVVSPAKDEGYNLKWKVCLSAKGKVKAKLPLCFN
jgi:hypothetical protein